MQADRNIDDAFEALHALNTGDERYYRAVLQHQQARREHRQKANQTLLLVFALCAVYALILLSVVLFS
jgi:hypothetical protein